MTHTLTPLFPYHPYPYIKKNYNFSIFQIQLLNTEHPHNSLTHRLQCTNGHRSRAPAKQHQISNLFASNLRTPYLLFFLAITGICFQPELGNLIVDFDFPFLMINSNLIKLNWWISVTWTDQFLDSKACFVCSN